LGVRPMSRLPASTMVIPAPAAQTENVVTQQNPDLITKDL